MKARSITTRWMLTTLAIILLILIVVNIGFIVSIKNYFYNAAEQLLVSNATSNYHLIQLYSSDMSKNINNEIRSIVENSQSKDQIEIMSLDFSGQVTYTSSGFQTQGQDNPEDYNQALASPDTSGTFIGYLENNEHVMAHTQLITATNNEFSALRYMVSLKGIDDLVLKVAMIFVGVSAIVLILVVLLGYFFVNSIVNPIKEIGGVVSKIAGGDMSARIKQYSNDELGQLSETINYMADELAYSEKIKNEFISSVSHELRTPLTAIQGWSETVLSVGTGDSETVFKGMSVINSETERLSEMVEELLDFSNVHSGKLKLKKDKMDIFAELEEAVLIYTEYAKKEGKQLIFDEDKALPVIYGDKNRIRQVFINIIDNSLKYSDKGDTIMVKAQVIDKNIHIKVVDTGCGIAEKDISKVTKKFYKANNTRRGSGIGLAIATEIVNMHDGKFKIESALGEGTAVTLTFPAYEESKDTDDYNGLTENNVDLK